MSLFISILLGQNRYPPPPEGSGRVHRLEDYADDVPPQDFRLNKILEAVRLNPGSTAGQITAQLPYQASRTTMTDDLNEMIRRGILIRRHIKGRFCYFESTGDNKTNG
jgi:hypothetical protein